MNILMIVIFGFWGIILGIAIRPISKEIISYKTRQKTGEKLNCDINKKNIFLRQY